MFRTSRQQVIDVSEKPVLFMFENPGVVRVVYAFSYLFSLNNTQRLHGQNNSLKRKLCDLFREDQRGSSNAING